MKKIISTIIVITLLSNTLFPSVSANKKHQHRIKEIITYCTKSIYNTKHKNYISDMRDENGNIYKVYTKDNIKNKWFVLIVDDKANNNIKDNECINMYLLDNYIFK